MEALTIAVVLGLIFGLIVGLLINSTAGFITFLVFLALGALYAFRGRAGRLP